MTKVSDHRPDRTPSTTPFQNHSNHRRPLHQDREICIAKCLNACSQRSNIGSTSQMAAGSLISLMFDDITYFRTYIHWLQCTQSRFEDKMPSCVCPTGQSNKKGCATS
ncbi:hypothetical protein EYR41_006227 [Orbilia oligospora]|uniref:Uncharacterized protein n=1 Tax=Orbilia oligospora TaxID=2813651 RepID=A0A8H2HT40_ORBOL|nr:hypothetical protein EYR41_006227 [Orbilia oligospora]